MVFVIAIDGHAASGKGTLAENIAEFYNFAHLDSGKLYRLVAYQLLQNSTPPFTEEDSTKIAQNLNAAIPFALMKNAALTEHSVSKVAAEIAPYPALRASLKKLQQAFANEPYFEDATKADGVVIDGRDIGTVICPNAQVKLFVTADIACRAKRRHQQFPDIDYNDIYEAIKQRDHNDESRKVAPLKCADDAALIDTSQLSVEQATQKCLKIIEESLIGQ